MTDKRLSIPEIILISGTRVMLGLGVGLLIAGKISSDARKGAGWALVGAGGLSSVPIALGILHKSQGGERA